MSHGHTPSAWLAWRRPLATMSLLWVSSAAGAGIAFVTQVVLARELGPSRFGLFASSLATVSMVAPSAGFGLSQFWLQAYGVEGWAANRWLRPSLRFAVATTALAAAMIAIWSVTGAPDDETRWTLRVLLPVILSVLAVDLVGSKLRLEERYGSLAVWQLSIPSARLLVALALLALPWLPGGFVAVGYAVSSLLIVIVALPALRMMLAGRLELRGHGERSSTQSVGTPSAGRVWSLAWPYGAASVLYPIFLQVGTLLLKYMAGNAQAGLFGVALAVMLAIYLIPTTVYQKFLLSKLYRWAAHDPAKFWLVYRKGRLAMLLGGIAIGASLAASASWIVPTAFGKKYEPVVRVLQLLAICTPIRFSSTAVGSALLSARHMRYRVVAMSVATLATIAFNVVLIPRYGEIGAASATIMGELVLLGAMYLVVRRLYGPQLSGKPQMEGMA